MKIKIREKKGKKIGREITAEINEISDPIKLLIYKEELYKKTELVLLKEMKKRIEPLLCYLLKPKNMDAKLVIVKGIKTLEIRIKKVRKKEQKNWIREKLLNEYNRRIINKNRKMIFRYSRKEEEGWIVPKDFFSLSDFKKSILYYLNFMEKIGIYKASRSTLK